MQCLCRYDYFTIIVSLLLVTYLLIRGYFQYFGSEGTYFFRMVGTTPVDLGDHLNSLCFVKGV
jgi:hypothetical protein